MPGMIPADNFHDNGDGTAWTLLTELAQYVPASEFPETWLDRPCDTCDGRYGWLGAGCLDCIDGRDTFNIEVRGPLPGSTLFPPLFCSREMRASVVPGMVLPIVRGACPGHTNDVHRPAHVHLAEPSDDDETASGICHENCDLIWDSPWNPKNAATLPPSATVGQWAVKLRIEAVA